MKVIKNSMTLELTSNDDIEMLWDIVAFALDHDAEHRKTDHCCMTNDEREFAKALEKLLRTN